MFNWSAKLEAISKLNAFKTFERFSLITPVRPILVLNINEADMLLCKGIYLMDPLTALQKQAQSCSPLELPFNSNAIKIVFEALGDLNLEKSIYEDSDQSERLCLIDLHIQRVKNISLEYIMKRLDSIYYKMECNSMPKYKLAEHEQKLYESFRSSFNLLGRSLIGSGNFNTLLPSSPPKELFVHVRVIKDCGTIQTSSGLIKLNQNTSHYIRKSYIESLLEQGHLELIK